MKIDKNWHYPEKVSKFQFCCPTMKHVWLIHMSWDRFRGEVGLITEDRFEPIKYCPWCAEEIEITQ